MMATMTFGGSESIVAPDEGAAAGSALSNFGAT
jgi:hypothetical protein